jgi:hypothetical protein
MWQAARSELVGTASTTQTQAGGTTVPAGADLYRIATVSNANDAVTLGFAARPGRRFFFKNAGASTVGIFPGPGDKINAAAVDAVFALATVKMAVFYCALEGTWEAGVMATT